MAEGAALIRFGLQRSRHPARISNASPASQKACRKSQHTAPAHKIALSSSLRGATRFTGFEPLRYLTASSQVPKDAAKPKKKTRSMLGCKRKLRGMSRYLNLRRRQGESQHANCPLEIDLSVSSEEAMARNTHLACQAYAHDGHLGPPTREEMLPNRLNLRR